MLFKFTFLWGSKDFICSEQWSFNIDLGIAVMENCQRTRNAQR